MSPHVEIVQASVNDAPSIYAVTADAFGQEDEAKLIAALAQEGATVLTLVARLEDGVAGVAVFSRVRLETAEGMRPAVALGPLAVAPRLQRRGLGSALVREGLARLAAMGESAILVLGDPSYYGRFGFTAEAAAPIEAPWSGPYLQALTLGREGPPGRCRAVYATAFGAFG